MLIAGSLLALVCGLANSAAAALEKREMLHAAPTVRGIRVLAVLVRRRVWLVAIVLSVIAWVAEAGALALAAVPVVTTLRSLGRGGLVASGHLWLGERFGRIELVGLGLLAAGGILTASSVASSHVAGPLSNVTEFVVAAVAALLAAALSRARNGLVLGSAAGVLFVATGVFTKEIGDRVAREGPGGIIALLGTPGPWLMVALGIWSLSMIQHAFARANAASVAAANATVSNNGLIGVAAILYQQRLASGAELIPLVIGIVISTLGAVALAVGEFNGTGERQVKRSSAASHGRAA